MPIYATANNEGEWISQDAEILEFETREDAEDYLCKVWSLEPNESLTLTAGSFSDCWIKSTTSPDGLDYGPFSAEQLQVSAPGTHPGGPWWWITPGPEVLVGIITYHDNVELDDD